MAMPFLVFQPVWVSEPPSIKSQMSKRVQYFATLIKIIFFFFYFKDIHLVGHHLQFVDIRTVVD